MQVHVHARRIAPTLRAGVCVLALLVGGTSVVGGAAGASAGPPAVETPTVTPATGGGGVPMLPGFTAFDPAEVGYEQSEVFLSGTATAYQADGTFGPDGKFAVAPASTASYTTRAVVMRPTDPDRFNGTVVVEWLNVSGGADAGPDWMMAHNQLLREGAIWVGVSAQEVGVSSLKSDEPVGGTPVGDPVRYADLSHPGDSYSYDIYSQAGQAIVDAADVFLGGLRPEQLIAVGESQSAGRLVTYIDAVHPVAGVYDGFLVHSTFGGGTPLSQAPQPDVPVPSPAPIRDDLDVPVLVFQAETDVARSGGAARQPDTPLFRLWEVAGTAHFDLYGLDTGLTDIGDGRAGVEIFESMLEPTNQPNEQFTCDAPINTGPAHYVLDAAFHHLDRWVAEGIEPPSAPRLETVSTSPFTLATDDHGNVLGGVRTPALDVPVATLSGSGQSGTSFCAIFGTTTPFDAAKLAELYPSHDDFVDAWIDATVSAYEAGFVTAIDAWELLYAGIESDIGR